MIGFVLGQVVYGKHRISQSAVILAQVQSSTVRTFPYEVEYLTPDYLPESNRFH